MAVCPKCGYQRTSQDTHVPEGVCPACGIAYAKWIAAQQAMADAQDESAQDEDHEYLDDDEPQTLWLKARDMVLYVPDRVDPVVFWSRVAAYAFFFIWGWRFIFGGMDWIAIGESFMHNINLPFHEFGHVIFRPFGRFMTILGGSLFQIMMPLIVMGVFIRQRDNLEAAIMLWWAGQNFIDLTPYIADAEYRSMPLIAGMGEEAHDWGNLLTMMGMVEKAWFFGKVSFTVGVIIMLVSFAWGGYILWQQKKNTVAF